MNRVIIASLVYAMVQLTPLASQTWFEGSPNWKYQESYWDCNYMSIGFDLVQFVKDTLIDGLEMQLFRQSNYQNTMGEISTSEGEDIYYEQGGIVYTYGNGMLTRLYDFTRSLGYIDTIEWEVFDYEFCDSFLLLRLDAIDQIFVANDTLDVQRWSKLKDTIVYPNFFTVVEKIGAVGHHPFWAPLSWHCGLDPCYPYTFACYYNEDLSLNYPVNADCSFLVLNEEPPRPDKAVTVFPNPTPGPIKIEPSDGIAAVRVYDLAGALILEENTGYTLDLGEAPPGIYYIKVIYQNGFGEVNVVVRM